MGREAFDSSVAANEAAGSQANQEVIGPEKKVNRDGRSLPP
jgi:hypothetical protein